MNILFPEGPARFTIINIWYRCHSFPSNKPAKKCNIPPLIHSSQFFHNFHSCKASYQNAPFKFWASQQQLMMLMMSMMMFVTDKKPELQNCENEALKRDVLPKSRRLRLAAGVWLALAIFIVSGGGSCHPSGSIPPCAWLVGFKSDETPAKPAS